MLRIPESLVVTKQLQNSVCRFKTSIGLDVGSTTVKVFVNDSEDPKKSTVHIKPHHGLVQETIKELVTKIDKTGEQCYVTGRLGRQLLNIAGIPEAVAIENGLKLYKKEQQIEDKIGAVVSLGGETYIVYKIGGVDNSRIIDTYSGNKCASGTGQFFSQQLGRMDMDSFKLKEYYEEIKKANPLELATRCSVFMKTDCTHKLNKGEATKYDIVLSLAKVMAHKVAELLQKAQIVKGKVVLIGGMVNISFVVDFLKLALPEVEFLLPKQATYFESFGAADLSLVDGQPLPSIDTLLSGSKSEFQTVGPLTKAKDLVTFVKAPEQEKPQAGMEYILGVDGGSTTTKVALIDRQTKGIVSSYYGRTLGDPIKALRQCLVQVKKDLGPVHDQIRISHIATTGSSRELLGVFTGTKAIYNEIIAHTVGATFYQKDVDTIFEIGGQDAKYVYLRNMVPIDYAMNEACSAGTGSFLEESCSGDLKIMRAQEIAPIALSAEAPLKFSQHCSAFINSDIRRASQEGAKKEDIVAGLVLSIANNYLDRVVGNRRIGDYILMQGGVAKNAAVPMAVASILKKKIIVPPNPELLGSFGVGLLALQKIQEGKLEDDSTRNYSLEELINRPVETKGEFVCHSCENNCPIKIIQVGENEFFFGGRCNKYTQIRNDKLTKLSSMTTGKTLKKKRKPKAVDYIKLRKKLHFGKYAPDSELLPEKAKNVLVPTAFSVHMFWPLYSNFFYECGVKTQLVDEPTQEGSFKCSSDYCYPAELAHQLMETCLQIKEDDYDFIFIPHLKKSESFEEDVNATFCPLSQGTAYLMYQAFGFDRNKMLYPVLNFENSMENSGNEMIDMAIKKLGISKSKAQKAWEIAVKKYKACQRECFAIGDRVLKEHIRKTEENSMKKKEDQKELDPLIVLFGKAYNAFSKHTNMSIPKKFVSRGSTILPFDFISPNFDNEKEEICDNMFWYYGQHNLQVCKKIKKMENAYACIITNFSCGPDSILLHYIRWTFNTKPFLILELDSHVADAGVDTRIEAFLDIIKGYDKISFKEKPILADHNWERIQDGDDVIVRNEKNHEETYRITDKKVTLLIPAFEKLMCDMITNYLRNTHHEVVTLDLPSERTLHMARSYLSGKECLPTGLILGTILDYTIKNKLDKDRIYLSFFPTACGPCRAGQYGVFFDHLFREIGFENLRSLNLHHKRSFAELGKDIPKFLWYCMVVADKMKEIYSTFRTLAVNKKEAFELYHQIEKEMNIEIRGGIKPFSKKLRSWGKRMGQIQLQAKHDEVPKVFVVGDIYLRRDPFSVEPLLEMISNEGIVCKVEDFCEWLFWVDYSNVTEKKKKLAKMPLHKRYLSEEFRGLMKLKIEMAYKHHVYNTIIKDLSYSNALLPTFENNQTFKDTADLFGGVPLGTEAVPGSAGSAMCMKNGYDGVAIFSPFTCLHGRLAQGLYNPYAREMEYPTLSIEHDGNAWTSTILTNIETFSYNVKARYNERKKLEKEKKKN
ncbi:activator of 2-hydroxyacyl-coa-hydratase-related [Anaeramoeba flamelloides]|uniref:N-acetyl-D-glucosamine kinase n=1 Tax=Anaeramoeba flamelloides TaxID=1746091 RepID=A0AAV7YM75_9EUKA|nr:activator of 2-hydroxyacyl-coa-hydratase-related [Anaeramoeba flamelloides]